ncbi:MAG TPA: hypothetical protein VFR72_01395 [Gemmatimonadales bacterium]|nr:hypothetical protein [Gemmatimonadales bacterium]
MARFRKLSGRLATSGHTGMRRQYTIARRTGRLMRRTAGDVTLLAYHHTATLTRVTSTTQGHASAAASARRGPAIAHHDGA